MVAEDCVLLVLRIMVSNITQLHRSNRFFCLSDWNIGLMRAFFLLYSFVAAIAEGLQIRFIAIFSWVYMQDFKQLRCSSHLISPAKPPWQQTGAGDNSSQGEPVRFYVLVS